ncbi:hypothetical protein [Bradyrhizobium paxllaeri]|uniref:hypothetical protein n=1 Tax=Bradyrhizobium paxllaeri TaxID=190148 RepID=UPI0016523AE6|nr:hypothetical protein [Bradyrhizobium paxllaeri]
MAQFVGVIWVLREAVYFSAHHWTGQISLKLQEKIAHWRSVQMRGIRSDPGINPN